MDFERGEYIYTQTLGLMNDTKDSKRKSVVKNNLKHIRNLTKMELDMAANQCLVTNESEKCLWHALKTIGEQALNRKKMNETYYITMVEYLNPTPLYLVQYDKKKLFTR